VATDGNSDGVKLDANDGYKLGTGVRCHGISPSSAGSNVGSSVGYFDGSNVGDNVDMAEGVTVGDSDGDADGRRVGTSVVRLGCAAGCVGPRVG